MPNKIEPIVLRGLPLERGVQHGQLFKDKISEYITSWIEGGHIDPWPECIDFCMKYYHPAIVKYFPEGLEEMKGIAQGSGRSLEDIIVLNSVAEMFRLHSQRKRRKRAAERAAASANEVEQHNGRLLECTGAFCLPQATKSGDVFIGQNFDNMDEINGKDYQVLFEIQPDPSEKIAPFYTVTEVGQLTRNGANANGLGLVGMWVFMTTDAPEPEEGKTYLPTQLMRRRFLHAPTYALGLQALLIAPRHISMSVVIATREGDGMVLELSPTNQYFVYPDPAVGILTHSNSFLSPILLSREQEELSALSTHYRDRRLLQLLTNSRPLDEAAITNAFSDHLGQPDSICTHLPKEGQIKQLTISTQVHVMYNLTKNTVRVCRGNPCQNKLESFSLSL